MRFRGGGVGHKSTRDATRVFLEDRDTLDRIVEVPDGSESTDSDSEEEGHGSDEEVHGDEGEVMDGDGDIVDRDGEAMMKLVKMTTTTKTTSLLTITWVPRMERMIMPGMTSRGMMTFDSSYSQRTI